MPRLIVNGKQENFAEVDLPTTMAALLDKLKLDARHVVAELDGDIIPREKFGEHALRVGQKIELIRFAVTIEKCKALR